MGTGVPRAPEDGAHGSSAAGLVLKGTRPPLHNVLPNSSELQHEYIAVCFLVSLCSWICCYLENGVTSLKLWAPQAQR